MIGKMTDWLELEEQADCSDAGSRSHGPVAPGADGARVGGDLAATGLPDLYRCYWAELCRYVKRAFGKGPPEPEDIVQAAFSNFAALEDPQAVRNPRAMLYTIARNIAIRQHQREAMIARHGRELSSAAADENLDESDPERVLIGKERFAILDAAMARMAPERRRVLILNRLHGLSYAEISRRTGISQTQVKRLVALALVECQRALRAGS